MLSASIPTPTPACRPGPRPIPAIKTIPTPRPIPKHTSEPLKKWQLEKPDQHQKTIGIIGVTGQSIIFHSLIKDMRVSW